MKIGNGILREMIAEFLATFFLTVCGDGVQAILTFRKVGDASIVTGALGWSCALMIAICIAGGVSGGHANPAATLALATVGKCSWRKVLPYMFSQYFGASVAGVVIYFLYHDALDHFDGGIRSVPPHPNATAHIFSCYPQQFVSISTCILDQVIGTALLLLMVSSVTDYKNMEIPRCCQPILVGFGMCTILLGFGYNCMAPLNPARDLGPRIATAILGWGTKVFSFRNYKWFWVPIIGPHIGGVVGAWLYRLSVELHWPMNSYEVHSEDSKVDQIQKLGNKICQTPECPVRSPRLSEEVLN